MSHATGEFASITLSSFAVRSAHSTSGRPQAVRHMLSDEARTLDFDLVLANGEHVKGTLAGSGEEPTWLWRVLDGFRRLSDLPPNWDSYSAHPLTATAIRRCLQEVVSELLSVGASEPTVLPTRVGGIQLEWRRQGIDIEITVPPAGPISYLIADANTGEEVEWEGDFNRRAVFDAFARMA